MKLKFYSKDQISDLNRSDSRIGIDFRFPTLQGTMCDCIQSALFIVENHFTVPGNYSRFELKVQSLKGI